MHFLVALSLNLVSIDCLTSSMNPQQRKGESWYRVVIRENNLIFIIHLMPDFPRQYGKPGNF